MVTNLSASARVVEDAEVSPSMILSSAAVADIELPAICSVVAFTSPELPYITALLLTIVPEDEPSV